MREPLALFNPAGFATRYFARRIDIWKSAARAVVLFTWIVAGLFASRGTLSQPVSLR